MDHLTEQKEIDITPRISSTLVSVAGWMRIAALASFAGIIVSVVSVVLDFINTPDNAQNVPVQMVSTLIYVSLAVILNLLLLGAASGIKKGVISGSQDNFNRGINKFTAYFRVTGIIIIILLLIIIVALVFVCLAGLSGAFDGL